VGTQNDDDNDVNDESARVEQFYQVKLLIGGNSQQFYQAKRMVR
jgi:hypothetical protein